MDEINKEIEKEKIGITVDELNEIIGCLLWVDDVVLIAESAEQMQKMLDITNQIAGKYHIEFGEAKSNVMKIGGNKDKPEFKLGEMKLKYCDKYKYLGIIFNNKENLKDHIPHLKGKTEAAYQTILSIAGNRYFNQLEMSTIWTLFESIITAIITYGSDTWTPNKTETKAINSLMDNIIKRILITPSTTPREVLYMETGLLDPETISKKQRILTDYKMQNNTIERLKNITTIKGKGSWKEITDRTKNELKITEQLTGKINTVKLKVKTKTKEYFEEKLKQDAKDKSKVKFYTDNNKSWKPGKRAEYMDKLYRNETSTIFRARTRMLDIKNNFKGKYINHKCNNCKDNEKCFNCQEKLKCRACNQVTETQEHVLNECETLHPGPGTKVSTEDIFKEDPKTLRTIAHLIDNTVLKLNA